MAFLSKTKQNKTKQTKQNKTKQTNYQPNILFVIEQNQEPAWKLTLQQQLPSLALPQPTLPLRLSRQLRLCCNPLFSLRVSPWYILFQPI
jgi:hypothetical protein